ncbi:class I SAM-dependent methyltransferase [Desulfovibrio sp. QI0434]
MFKLLPPLNVPYEFDGRVNFVWLPQKVQVQIPPTTKNCFLELRLGYPLDDPLKKALISNQSENFDDFKLAIHKGWQSYFIPLSENSKEQILTISFSHSLECKGDLRFLGAMLSYWAITDNIERVEEIASINKIISHAVNLRDEEDTTETWVSTLHGLVTHEQDQFYQKKALPPINIDLNNVLQSLSVDCKREILLSNNIKRGSSVLEIGCGKGTLGFLSQRDIKLTAIDLSIENCRVALKRGYTSCLTASAEQIPFPDDSFDYVVSADVFGHIPVEKKRNCLEEISRVLKSNGTTIHFIETDEFDPTVLSPSDYARMVLVDGHIGIEPLDHTIKLFSSYFSVIMSQLIGNSFMSAKHWLRAHDLYGDNLPGELVSFLQNASAEEFAAFNLGSGISFWRSLQAGMKTMSSGGMLFIMCKKTDGEVKMPNA